MFPKAVIAAILLATSVLSASVSSSANQKPKKPCEHRHEARFYSPFGWQRCHCLTFSCKNPPVEVLQDVFFGKTNETEIKFPTGMCHAGTLLCIEVSFDEKEQRMTVILSETEDNEEWPDAILKSLEAKKPIGYIETHFDDQCMYGEWDEMTYWQPSEENKKKIDFMDLIFSHER